MGAKEILAYTNPITIAVAVPFSVGVLIGVMVTNLFKNTKRVLSEVKEDVMGESY